MGRALSEASKGDTAALEALSQLVTVDTWLPEQPPAPGPDPSGTGTWQAVGSPMPIQHIYAKYQKDIPSAHAQVDPVATIPPGTAAMPPGYVVSDYLHLTAERFTASDILVILMLVPVLLLYIQNARAKYQESASFAVIVVGVVASLVLAYFYELLRGESLGQIAAVEFQQGSLLDALYIFGYLIVTVSLYAHRMHQSWSYQRVDELLIK